HDYWAVDDYPEAAVSWHAAQAYLRAKTEGALDLLRAQPDTVLNAKRTKLDANIPMSAWRFLMMMLDAEIHHRAQLSTYLMLLDVRRPRMDALSIEAVQASLKAK
ncbi:MAG: DinB family protein, partial [Anaerolineae bacterium]